MFHTGRIDIGNGQFGSVTQSCLTLCNPKNCRTPGFLFLTNSRSLLKLMSIKTVMPSNCLTLCRPLLLLPSIFPSLRVFFDESTLHIRWPKYWSFSISPYLFRLWIFLPAILIPAHASSSLAFCMMYSA